MGGDNVGFAAILKACASALETAPGATLYQDIGGTQSEGNLSGNCSSLLNQSGGLVGTGGTGPMMQTLQSTYEQILAQMPATSQLSVGTYPQVFPQPGAYTGIGGFCAGPGVGVTLGGIGA